MCVCVCVCVGVGCVCHARTPTRTQTHTQEVTLVPLLIMAITVWISPVPWKKWSFPCRCKPSPARQVSPSLGALLGRGRGVGGAQDGADDPIALTHTLHAGPMFGIFRVRPPMFARVDVFHMVRLFHAPKSQRLAILDFNEITTCLKSTRGWQDSSPIPACTRYGRDGPCDQCLAERHAITVIGYDPYCPEPIGGIGHCLWGMEKYGGLCEECHDRLEFGCGWGDHTCPECVYSRHGSEITAVQCPHCGPCQSPVCEAAGEYHCLMVCMQHGG
jgi:hypothetical protein